MLGFDVNQYAQLENFINKIDYQKHHFIKFKSYRQTNDFQSILETDLNLIAQEFCETNYQSNLLTDNAVEKQSYWEERLLLKEYLRWLIQQVNYVQTGGIRQVNKLPMVLPLDYVYIGLQAESDTPSIDQRVMRETLSQITQKLEQLEDPKERAKLYETYARDTQLLEQIISTTEPEQVELSAIIQCYRNVVILGDPGSGKTTLLRYLAMCFANGILKDLDFWLSGDEWQLKDLGPVRLPIFIRIAPYAEARNPEQGGDSNLSLSDYLIQYFSQQDIPQAKAVSLLLMDYLESGRCLVLLDGLDEVINYADRNKIVNQIQQFTDIYGKKGLLPWQENLLSSEHGLDWQGFLNEESEEIDINTIQHTLIKTRLAFSGNHFVVTSRIAGYDFAPLNEEFDKYTIRTMDIQDIRHFLERWCFTVEQYIDTDRKRGQRRARQEVENITKLSRGVCECQKNGTKSSFTENFSNYSS